MTVALTKEKVCPAGRFLYKYSIAHTEILKPLLQFRREFKFMATIYKLKPGVRFAVNCDSVKSEEAFCQVPHGLPAFHNSAFNNI